MATKPFPHKLLSGGLALALLATACGSDTIDDNAASSNGGTDSSFDSDGADTSAFQTETITIDGNDIVLTSGLATFDDCDALLTHLRTEGAERVGPWGFNGGGYIGMPTPMGIAGDDAMDEAEMVEESADFAADAAAPTSSTTAQAERASGEFVEGEDFSGTNNQEAGVDEPDYVKTDGERIYTVTNGTLTITDANDGDPVVRGSIFTGWDTRDMLIVGERIFVIGTTWGDPGYDIALEDDAEASFADSEVVDGPAYYGPQVQVIEVDMSDVDELAITAELKVDGHYLSARLIDGKINVALQSDQYDFGFVYPQGEKGEEQAEEFNRQIIMESEIGDWLPTYRLSGGDVSGQGQLADCGNVHAPADFSGFGSLSVVTIDGAEGLSTPQAASVLASGQNVYASTSSMWISTNQWFDWELMDDAARSNAENSFTTQIHGFSISGDTPQYTASGSVRGHLLNQFALSEYEGVLRVASTDGSMWGANPDSESFVTTFSVDGNELVQLGQVGDMGKGEQIFSVRFVGDIAYVVTFRQTDPFYTVDLSDPAAPVVLGELKITGFSGQLHPLGPDHVLGIGQEATEEGRTTGAKVTLFDVSDLSDPIDVANWTVDNSWSDAQWDHKAFLWWPQENLAVLPVQNWQEQFFGAVAFRIDLEAGTLTEAGRIDHAPDRDAAVGATDCTVLDPELFEQYRQEDGDWNELTELAWMSFEVEMSGGQTQVCAPGQGGATGLYCERADWIDASELDITDPIEICWPEGPGQDPIVRTLVINDTLWSLSWSRLQANDLSTLESGPYVELR